MHNSINDSVQLITYDQIYLHNIEPHIKALDLFLKEKMAPFDIDEMASILKIEPSEIISFMKQYNHTEMDVTAFFAFILHSPSKICGYIRRQFKYQNQTQYTPEIVAEIYELNLHKVKYAFTELETASIESSQLVDIFKRIHITIFNNNV